MKKIILSFLVSIFLILVVLITYLSTVGVQTNNFNSQITSILKDFNENLDIELKKIQLVLNPFELKVDVNTIGPKLIIKNKTLEIENLKTQISIKSLFDRKFSFENLEISTKSLKINNLISFIRSLKQSPELFILEKIIKKGYLIADIKVEFDKQGNIKDNLIIKGFVKNGGLSSIKKLNINKIDFIFEYKKDYIVFNDINFSLNDLKLFSKNIEIKNLDKEFFVEGEIENKEIYLNKENIELLIKPFFSSFDIENVKFSSKNFFYLKFNEKFKLKDYKISSKLLVNEFSILNNSNLKNFFPKIRNNINFINNKLDLDYEKDNLKINGSGDILLQNKNDHISYNFKKKNKFFNLKTSLKINDNPFLINFLNFKKDQKLQTIISLEANNKRKNKFSIPSISLSEKNNKIKIENLELNKKFKIIDLDKIILDYADEENQKNLINLYKKDNKFFLEGSSFNAKNVIEHLFSNKTNAVDILNIDSEINVDIKKIRLDKKYEIKNFKGNLQVKDQKITKADLIGKFSGNKMLKFTVNTINENKITTLYSDEAEPLIKRYKFIKGFEKGSFDFYSSEKNNNSYSTLKIYDFKLKELPILTKLLTLASLQGIADILSGDGITFKEFEMNFEKNKNGMIIDEIYAIGPAISILMDGYLEYNKLISLKGTLVPATTINKVIGSIPFLGKILVGSKAGEGVFGVSFKIKGPPKDPKTTVNPIKSLTPRFVTRTLEKIKKN